MISRNAKRFQDAYAIASPRYWLQLWHAVLVQEQVRTEGAAPAVDGQIELRDLMNERVS